MKKQENIWLGLPWMDNWEKPIKCKNYRQERLLSVLILTKGPIPFLRIHTTRNDGSEHPLLWTIIDILVTGQDKKWKGCVWEKLATPAWLWYFLRNKFLKGQGRHWKGLFVGGRKPKSRVVFIATVRSSRVSGHCLNASLLQLQGRLSCIKPYLASPRSLTDKDIRGVAGWRQLSMNHNRFIFKFVFRVWDIFISTALWAML